MGSPADTAASRWVVNSGLSFANGVYFMKFVTSTRLFDTERWFIELLFLLMLPFLIPWKGTAMIARSSKVGGE
jgi:hypothetical protein